MTKSFSIPVTMDVPFERVENLLCSAFDPASNAVGYWGGITKRIEPPVLSFPVNDEDGVYPYMHYPLNEGGSLIIEVEEAVKGKFEFCLALPQIVQGLKVMASKFPRHFGDVLDENDDAETADIFVQCCLFGDVIFG